MGAIIVVAIILFIIYLIRQNNLEQQRQNEIRQKRLIEQQKRKQLEERLKQIKLQEAERKRNEAEKKRLEELNYENFTVVYATADENGKPNAIIKNKDNKYASIERNYPNANQYILGETLRLEKVKISNWSWYDETTYKAKIEKSREKELLQEQRKLQERQQQIITSWQEKLESLNVEYRNDWKEFIKIIEENRISKLYHFTDKSNIPSIKSNGGLFSWWAAQQNGIVIEKPGGIGFGRELDIRKGLENYVRLSFNKNNPMLYVARKEGRINKPVFLEIDPVVMVLKSTLFTKENATKNGVIPSSTLQFFQEIVEKIEDDSLGSFRKLLGGAILINPKAEILVLEKIPLEYIININSV